MYRGFLGQNHELMSKCQKLREYAIFIRTILRQQILRESNLDTLKGWIKLAIKSDSIAEFEDKM